MEVSRSEAFRIVKDISSEILEDYYHDTYLPISIERFVCSIQRIPKSSAGKALDIGCGYGVLSFAMKKMGYDVCATDFYTDHINKIKPNLFEKYKITLKQNNIEAEPLPYQDNAFDVVMFSEILEHLNDSPLVPLNEIRRVLKPNGMLILTTPNIASIKNIIFLIFGKNSIFMDLEDHYINPKRVVWSNNRPYYDRHNRVYTGYELKRLMNIAGLNTVSVDYVHGPGERKQAFYKKIFNKLLGLSVRLTGFRLLSEFIVLKAVKRSNGKNE